MPPDSGESGTTLVTALPASRLPGAVPTAPVGRALARVLREQGEHVRALVPRTEADGWPDGVEVLLGSVEEPTAVPHAFEDVSQVFLAGLVSKVPTTLRELTNRLLAGGARRVVVLSSHGSDFETEYSDESWPWLAFERALEVHGARWTHLRPVGLFANSVLGGYPVSGSDWCEQIRQGQAVAEFLPDVAYPFMDEEDLGRIAAALLSDEPPPGNRLDVCGQLVSARERFDAVNDAMGGTARLETLPDEETARRHWRKQGWPEATIDVTLFAMTAFKEQAETIRSVLAPQIDSTAHLLGRPPRSFRAWLSRNIGAFTHPDAAEAPAPSRTPSAQGPSGR